MAANDAYIGPGSDARASATGGTGAFASITSRR
jgi:hypothetical protein